MMRGEIGPEGGVFCLPSADGSGETLVVAMTRAGEHVFRRPVAAGESVRDAMAAGWDELRAEVPVGPDTAA